MPTQYQVVLSEFQKTVMQITLRITIIKVQYQLTLMQVESLVNSQLTRATLLLTVKTQAK